MFHFRFVPNKDNLKKNPRLGNLGQFPSLEKVFLRKFEEKNYFIKFFKIKSRVGNLEYLRTPKGTLGH